jgi:hypothetical protein
MHVYVLSDGELISVIALTAILMWSSAAFWTKRRIRKADYVSGRVQAASLEPLELENRELRDLVERQENRIRALETIATDPSERTARAIEALR